MKKQAWLRTTVRAAALAAGLLLLTGGGAARAASVDSGDNYGTNGTQVLAPIQSPLDLCGTTVTVGGDAETACVENTVAALIGPGGIADMHTTGNEGILNGTQLQIPTQIPVNACGVAVAVLGVSDSACAGGSSTAILQGPPASMDTMDNDGVLNGTQLLAPIQVPLNLCGISVSAGATAQASCAGAGSLAAQGLTSSRTSGNKGLINGWQFVIPVQVPVNVCGNAVAIASAARASCAGGFTNPAALGASAGTGILSGLAGESLLPVVTPVTDLATGGAVTTAENEDDIVAELNSIGNEFLGNGNELLAPIQLPIDATGNALGLGANSSAGSIGGALAVQ